MTISLDLNCETKESRNNRRRPKIVRKENRVEIRFENIHKKEVIEYQVDGCLIKHNQGVKCDFLYQVIDSEKAYFVEFKGKDVSHGYEQLLEAIKKLESQLPGYRLVARIVCTETPRKKTPNIMSTTEKQLRTKVKQDLIVKTLLLEEEL